MSKNRGEPVDTFAELASFFDNLQLGIPKIDENFLQDPSKLDEVKRKRLEICRQIQSQMASALKCLDQVEAWILPCTDRLERKNAEGMVADRRTKVAQFIADRLSEKDLIFRSVAALAVFKHFFQKKISCIEDRNAAVHHLQEYGLLLEDSQGPIRIGYKSFTISRAFGLDDDDRQEIGSCYEQFNRSFEKIEQQRRQASAGEMREDANLSLEEFKEGKGGKFFLPVPPQQGENERWLGGGNLLLENKEIDGEVYILPIRASGSFERVVSSMVDEGVRLLHQAIFWAQPPGGSSLIKKIEIEHNLSNEEAYRHVGKMKSFYHMIKRGLQQAEQKEQDKERAIAKLDAMTKAATISPEDFFGLATGELKDGIAFLEFQGAFELSRGRGPNLYYLSLLIERSELEGRRVLAILDAPEYHLNGIFQPFLDQIHEEDDKDFSMLPPALGRILRAIRSQTEKHLQLSQNAV